MNEHTDLLPPSTTTTAAGNDDNNNDDDDNNELNQQVLASNSKLGWISVGFFIFTSTAAGPLGLETLVAAAGPAGAITCVILIPLLMTVPIILMMSELSTWMPSNHGNIRWCSRALGSTVGFVNSFWTVMMNLVDTAIYPSLASNYIYRWFAPSLVGDFWPTYLLRIAIILVFGIPAFLPVKTMSLFSSIATILICAPFVVGFCYGIGNVNGAVLRETVPDTNFATILSIAVWLYVGFLKTSTISGEVKHSENALLWGQGTGLLLDMICYLLPIPVFQMNTKWAEWNDGYFSLAYDLLMGIGGWVAMAGFFCGVSLYTSSLVCYVRCMWGVAQLGWLPPVFGRKNRFDAPWVAGVVHITIAIILNVFEFEFLVKLEMIFGSMIFILFGVSFVVLRYTEPIDGFCEIVGATATATAAASASAYRYSTSTTTRTGTAVGNGGEAVATGNAAAASTTASSAAALFATAIIPNRRVWVLPGGNTVAFITAMPLIFVMGATLCATIVSDWKLALGFLGGILFSLLLYWYLFVFGRTEVEVFHRQANLRSSLVSGAPFRRATDSFVDVGGSMLYDDDSPGVDRIRNSEAIGSEDGGGGGQSVARGGSRYSSSTYGATSRQQQQHRRQQQSLPSSQHHFLSDVAAAAAAGSSPSGRSSGVRRSALREESDTRRSPHVAVDQF